METILKYLVWDVHILTFLLLQNKKMMIKFLDALNFEDSKKMIICKNNFIKLVTKSLKLLNKFTTQKYKINKMKL